MEKHTNESNKVMLGLLIGGVVGASALYLLHAAQNRKTPVLKKIGKTIADVGEMIESCDFGSCGGVMDTIEKNIPKGSDVLDNVVDWVDSGMNLWKKFKKGR